MFRAIRTRLCQAAAFSASSSRGFSSFKPPALLRSVLQLSANTADVSVTGWVKSVRKGKRVSFVVVNDGSCQQSLQIVCPSDMLPVMSQGAAVQATGTLVASKGSGQSLELAADALSLLGHCDNQQYPIQKKEMTDDYLREHPHLRARTSTAAAMLRCRSALFRASHDFFEKHDFLYTNTPIITSSNCEGAGDAFEVTAPLENDETSSKEHFFRHPVFMTVSGQLHAEAMAMSMSRVYTLGPTFRAENSRTPRHLAEFYMLEAEAVNFDLDLTMDCIEAYIKHCIEHVIKHHSADLSCLHSHYDQGLSASVEATDERPFPRVSFEEAVALLQSSTHSFRTAPSLKADLSYDHEQWLVQHYEGPVFVRDYPKQLKPFYMRMNDDNQTVAATDLLVPRIGELAGGSERETRLDLLDQRMHSQGLSEGYDWYRELRQFGSMPHAGFGVGMERILQYISGITSIRDAIPFPRHAGSARM